MNGISRLQQIKLRRSAIVAQNDVYRLNIQRDFNQLWPRVDYAARMLRIVNSLRSNISVIGSIAALLTVRSPSAVFSWVRRGWIVWQIARRFRRD
jgi:YqjK-like protein